MILRKVQDSGSWKKWELDRSLWRTRCGRGYGPVVRQTTKWICFVFSWNNTVRNVEEERKNQNIFSKKINRFQSKAAALIDRKLWINVPIVVKRHKINYILGKRYSREKIKIIIDIDVCRVGICFSWLAMEQHQNILASLQGGWRRKRTLQWRWHVEKPCCRDKQHLVFPSSGKQISVGLSHSPYLGLEFFEFIFVYIIYFISQLHGSDSCSRSS